VVETSISDSILFENKGAEAHAVLKSLHEHLRPMRYMEIGTWRGDSLKLASCSSLAVDPRFEVSTDIIANKPICAMFQMGSDAFFQAHDPTEVLGGPIDFAFLDGLHLFEALLRDFINTEKFVRRNAVIALHDCLPPMPGWAKRHHGPGDAWTGDVWKVPLILKQYRPDLKIHVLDSAETGLVLITNHDPSSTILSERYFDIVEEFRDLDLSPEVGEQLRVTLNVQSTTEFMSPLRLSQHFWLASTSVSEERSGASDQGAHDPSYILQGLTACVDALWSRALANEISPTEAQALRLGGCAIMYAKTGELSGWPKETQ
jgi:hypothetical protein